VKAGHLLFKEGEAPIKKMWCSVSQKEFSWADPEDPGCARVGSRKLTGTACVASSFDCGSGNYCVEVRDCVSDGPKLVLASESELEMEEWIEALLEANGGVDTSTEEASTDASSTHEFTVKDAAGEPFSLSSLMEKVVVIVNVATL